MVRRLSVAVLVDGVADAKAAGEAPAWRERTPEELARIAALVRSAVGFDERRGDRVEVVSMRFVEEPAAAAEASGPFGLPPLPPALLARLAESGLLALVALVGILAVGRPVVGKLSAAAAAGEGPPQSPPAPEALVSLSHVQGQMRASSLTAVAALVDRHPDEALAVLRRWLAPREAGGQA